MFSASSSVFLFARMVHKATKSSPQEMFLYYAVTGGFCLISSWCWPDKPFSGPQDLGGRGFGDKSRWSHAWTGSRLPSRGGSRAASTRPSAGHSLPGSCRNLSVEGTAPEEVDTLGAETIEQLQQQLLDETSLRTPAELERPLCMDLSTLPLKTQLMSLECIGLLAYFSVMMIVSTFYLTSLHDQLKNGLNDGGFYQNIFGIIYPLGFIATPIAGVLQDRVHFALAFAFVNGVNLVYQGLTLVPSLPAQVVTFIFYAAGRQMMFSVFFASIGRMFGYETFGVISGIGNGLAALTTLSVSPLFSLCQVGHGVRLTCC